MDQRSTIDVLRRVLTAARMQATMPARRRRLSQWMKTGQTPILVLFYHRVADEVPNRWTISTQRFRKHIELLSQHCEFISLDEVQRRVRTGDSPRPAVHITFDDGYADNFRDALPLLIQRSIPCTYFVTLDNIVSGRPFPHDVAAGQPLAVNTVEQLRALAKAGIEIGAHTLTHLDLGPVTDEQTIAREVVEATHRLSELVRSRVRFFAFPFGLPENISEAAIRAVHDAGLEGFCSAFGGYNVPGRDAFHIRRFHGDPDLTRLRNWLSLDPRKLVNEPAVEYALPGSRSRCSLTGVVSQPGTADIERAGR